MFGLLMAILISSSSWAVQDLICKVGDKTYAVDNSVIGSAKSKPQPAHITATVDSEVLASGSANIVKYWLDVESTTNGKTEVTPVLLLYHSEYGALADLAHGASVEICGELKRDPKCANKISDKACLVLNQTYPDAEKKKTGFVKYGDTYYGQEPRAKVQQREWTPLDIITSQFETQPNSSEAAPSSGQPTPLSTPAAENTSKPAIAE